MPGKKSKTIFRNPIFYIVLPIIIIKLTFLFFRFHLLIWDEAVYMAMGKWIYSGGSIGLWESIRPVGFPLLLGLFWKAGLNYIVSSDLVIMAFSVGAAVMTYLIAEDIFSRRIAVASAALIIMTPVFFHNSQLIMTGIPSLFFALFSLYLMIRKRYISAGFLSAAAFVFRYPAGLIFAAINLILINELLSTKDWKAWFYRFLRYNIPFILIIGAYLAYDRIAYGSIIGPLLLASQHQSVLSRDVTGIVQRFIYYPYTLAITNALLLFSIAPAFLRKKDSRTYQISIPLAVFFLYFAAIPHKEPRFALLFLPFIAILAVEGSSRLADFLKDYRILKLVLIIGSAILLLQPIIIDFMLFRTAPPAQPGFVRDYYMFFNEPVKSFILTSDPVPAAYTDNRYIGFYNNISDAKLVLDKYLDDAHAVIYTPASFPCKDAVCNESKALLEQRISSNANLLYNRTVNGEEKLIYVK